MRLCDRLRRLYQCDQLRRRSAFCSHLQTLIAGDQFLAEDRQLRATSPPTTVLRTDHRLAKSTIEAIDQQPGTSIGHVHGAPSGRDRSGFPYLFQQPYLAGTEPDRRAKFKANGKVGKSIKAFMGHGGGIKTEEHRQT